MSPYLVIIILAAIEGITEFLPISSTGHMILAKNFFNNAYFSKVFMDSFLVVVQLGAILAVVVYFWKKITPFVKDKTVLKQRFILYAKLAVAVLPAVISGLLLETIISDYLMNNVYVVAVTLIFYGILFLGVEAYHKSRQPDILEVSSLTFQKSFLIGVFQCLALIPGTSRSGATIIGSLFLGLSRGLAAEFSFFLAIPTMFGATLLKLIRHGLSFSGREWMYIAGGTFLAFGISYTTVRWLMVYIQKKDFKIFGIYRILLGILVLFVVLLRSNGK
jgi:undecaprenyl-diphosphatase